MSLAGGATLMTPEQAQQTIDAFKKEFTAKQQQKKTEQATKNKAEGDAFLASNKNQPGVNVPAGRPAISRPHQRHRRDAVGQRHGDGELSRHAD